MGDRPVSWCSRWLTVRTVAAFVWLSGLCVTWAAWLMSGRNVTAMAIGFVASYFLAWGLALFLSRQSRDEVAKRFVVVSASLCLCAVILELAAATRLVDFRDVFSTRGTEPCQLPGNLLDPELLHVRRPHLIRSGKDSGDIVGLWGLPRESYYDYDLRSDSNGFRNELDHDSAGIVVIGDSFIEGPFVAANELVTKVIGDQMRCDVANLGQASYGPQQELAVLRRFALPLRPRVCVWVFFQGNDLRDVDHYDMATKDWEAFSKNLHSFDKRSFVRNVLLRCHRLLVAPTQFAFAEQQTGILHVDGKPVRLFFLYEEHRLSTDELSALERVRTTLAAAQQLCESARTKLVVVFAPIKFRVYRGVCEFPSSSRCRHWEDSGLSERLASIVHDISAGVGFLDLTPALRAEAARGKLVYFPDDTHWNAAGHRVVGQAISDYLSSSTEIHAL